MINDGKEYDHLQPEIIRVMQRQFLHPIRSSRDERIMLRETAGCFHLALEKDRLRGQMEAGAKKHSIEETCKKHLCEETHINMMKEELQKERQRIIREREREAFHRECAQMTEMRNVFPVGEGADGGKKRNLQQRTQGSMFEKESV